MTSRRITEAWVVARLDRLWPVHNAALARLLVVLRRLFDGDLDTMLVLLTLAVGVESDDWPEALLAELRGASRHRPTNTQSIADATGIPRESVRRKLAALQSKGWVTRNDGGAWELTPRTLEDLRPGTRETVSYLRAVIAASVAAAEDEPPSKPAGV